MNFLAEELQIGVKLLEAFTAKPSGCLARCKCEQVQLSLLLYPQFCSTRLPYNGFRRIHPCHAIGLAADSFHTSCPMPLLAGVAALPCQPLLRWRMEPQDPTSEAKAHQRGALDDSRISNMPAALNLHNCDMTAISLRDISFHGHGQHCSLGKQSFMAH